MTLDQSIGFFAMGLMLFIGVALGFGTERIVLLLKERNERRKREKRELEEARVMFEQRIALKPKHMGARHASGAAPIIFGEVDSNDGQE